MDASNWLTASVALLGIAGTFGAGVLGKRSERQSAHEAWLRETRLKAYLVYLEASYNLWEAAVAAYEVRPTGDPHWVAIDEALLVAGRAEAAVDVAGPLSVARACRRLNKADYEAAVYARDHSGQRPADGELRLLPVGLHAQAAEDVFLAEIRKVFGSE